MTASLASSRHVLESLVMQSDALLGRVQSLDTEQTELCETGEVQMRERVDSFEKVVSTAKQKAEERRLSFDVLRKRMVDIERNENGLLEKREELVRVAKERKAELERYKEKLFKMESQMNELKVVEDEVSILLAEKNVTFVAREKSLSILSKELSLLNETLDRIIAESDTALEKKACFMRKVEQQQSKNELITREFDLVKRNEYKLSGLKESLVAKDTFLQLLLTQKSAKLSEFHSLDQSFLTAAMELDHWREQYESISRQNDNCDKSIQFFSNQLQDLQRIVDDQRIEFETQWQQNQELKKTTIDLEAMILCKENEKQLHDLEYASAQGTRNDLLEARKSLRNRNVLMHKCTIFKQYHKSFEQAFQANLVTFVALLSRMMQTKDEMIRVKETRNSYQADEARDSLEIKFGALLLKVLM